MFALGKKKITHLDINNVSLLKVDYPVFSLDVSMQMNNSYSVIYLSRHLEENTDDFYLHSIKRHVVIARRCQLDATVSASHLAPEDCFDSRLCQLL